MPRYGLHWEKIGFQGTDPATDLRGVGILGLCQLLFLVSNGLTPQMILQLLELSNDEIQVIKYLLWIFFIEFSIGYCWFKFYTNDIGTSETRKIKLVIYSLIV